MERKLVKQGQNALTVTLPSAWLQQYKLRAGNTVEVVAQNEVLLISTAKHAKSVSVTLDAKGTDRWDFWQHLLGAYLSGHDEIVILNPIQEDIEHFVLYLIGFSISQLDKKKCVLSSTVSSPVETLSQLLSRIRYQFGALGEALESNLKYDDVKRAERVLDATLYYTMRYLRKYSSMQKDYQHFLLCLVIEEASDNVSELLQFAPQKHNKDIVAKTISLFVHATYEELFEYLKKMRKSMPKKTFADGLTYSVVETLYNFSGYVAKERWQIEVAGNKN